MRNSLVNCNFISYLYIKCSKILNEPYFRKATYLVALKASRMNNLNSDSGVFNEKELDYALERVTEDDDDFGFTPHCRSVKIYFVTNNLKRGYFFYKND